MLSGRIWALMIKEFLTLMRDPRGRVVLIAPPIVQLILFAFAATLDVINVDFAIYNQDMGVHGREIAERISGSPEFEKIIFLHNNREIAPALDEQEAIGALIIPKDFSRQVEAGQPVSLQTIMDGRRSNAAQIVNSYVMQIVEQYSEELRAEDGEQPVPIVTVARNWFNENLNILWYNIPCLVGLISMMLTLMVTALSVARERELGTFEQLLVSPLSPIEILLGKTITAMIIGGVEGCLILAVGVLLFGVPFRGSFLLLIISLIIFVWSVVGIGLFISSLCKTQQQAILGCFVFLVPAIALSGFGSPVENMPNWLQQIIVINPLMHFLMTSKGIFLKDMTILQVWANTWPLFIIGSVSLVLAGLLFSRRMS